ncbi:Glyoxalase-like domain protein [Bacillus sp. THAF10]|uniref:VOC family protein n=1 Tax=Bacillus sp. THAF10 TaxID=2587848 RepID=UPI001268217C|nr:VOC family protein [Bacillus sp. THAF10]QFT87504.1 Glyoxalase-like domain protein [Bacillus sp. THAF10]
MNRLNILTLGTKDILKAHTFFKNLGFDTSIRGEETAPAIIFFKNEGTRLALYPLEELRKDINKENPPVVGGGFQGITLAYNTKTKAEVDEIFQKVERLGGVIQKTPQTADWGGYSGYFTDLDGYYWEVAYSEFWEFDEGNMLVIEDQE